jgi:N-acetylglucosamine-6-sulfatase
MSRWLVVCAASVLALCVLVSSGCTRREEPRQNILFVLTDDLNTRLLPYLPELQQMLPAKGMSLELTIPTPVCVPSRASILAARYAHNTGVTRNGPLGGGIWAFEKNGSAANTFGRWLHDAGYHTGFFGKYLNDHEKAGASVPPGWDRWSTYGKVSLTRAGFSVIEDGNRERKIDRIYDTDFFAAEAVRWLQTVPEPFLAVWTPMAPHGPFIPPERHRGKFANVELQWPPSFTADADEVTKLTRTRLELMLGVQEGLQSMLATLEKRGLLDRTWIFFTSDHGLFMGEHGFAAGKGEYYEETIRVPLFVRGPGVQPGSRSDALITNTDLGPDVRGDRRREGAGRRRRPLVPAGPAGQAARSAAASRAARVVGSGHDEPVARDPHAGREVRALQGRALRALPRAGRPVRDEPGRVRSGDRGARVGADRPAGEVLRRRVRGRRARVTRLADRRAWASRARGAATSSPS